MDTASEEGQGQPRAVEPVMMIIVFALSPVHSWYMEPIAHYVSVCHFVY